MINLLNAELYKLRKSRSFFVCLLVAIAFVIFVCITLKMEKETSQQGTTEQGTAVVVVEEKIEIIDMEEMMLSATAGILLSIFVSIFVIGEYSDGAVKNSMGKGYAREKIFLAKYLTAIFASIVLFLAILFVTLLAGMFVMGTEGLNAEFVHTLCKYGGMQLLFEIAFMSVVCLVGETFRNMGIGVSVSLGLMIVGHLVFSGLDAVLSFIHVDFKTSAYWIANLISGCPLTDMSHDFVVQGLTAAAFWIIASVAVGIFHIKVADVK